MPAPVIKGIEPLQYLSRTVVADPRPKTRIIIVAANIDLRNRYSVVLQNKAATRRWVGDVTRIVPIADSANFILTALVHCEMYRDGITLVPETDEVDVTVTNEDTTETDTEDEVVVEVGP